MPLDSPLILTIPVDDAAAVVDANIFICPVGASYELTEVREAHAVAGTDGSAVTLDVKKATGTQAPSAGATLLTSTFDLKAAANTVVTKTRGAGIVTALPTRTLSGGDRLCLDVTGTPTSVAGIAITFVLVLMRKAKNRGR